MYNAFGDFASAQAVVERLPDETRSRAQDSVDFAKEKPEVGELSAFERAFVDVPEPRLNWAVLNLIKRSPGETEEGMGGLASTVASREINADRTGMLQWVRAMLLPARALGGIAAMASIVESVRDFDQRLLDAGRLIGRAQAGPAN